MAQAALPLEVMARHCEWLAAGPREAFDRPHPDESRHPERRRDALRLERAG